MRWIVETLRDGGVPVRAFVATGGLPHHNPLLIQIYADVLGEPITVHPCKHGPALGAAMLGALAAGAFASPGAAIRAMATREARHGRRVQTEPPPPRDLRCAVSRVSSTSVRFFSAAPGSAETHVAEPVAPTKRRVQLVASGDLRLAANQVCWPAQAAMEQALTAALERRGRRRRARARLCTQGQARLHRLVSARASRSSATSIPTRRSSSPRPSGSTRITCCRA